MHVAVRLSARIARMDEPLLLRDDATFVPIMCAPDASEIIRCVR